MEARRVNHLLRVALALAIMVLHGALIAPATAITLAQEEPPASTSPRALFVPPVPIDVWRVFDPPEQTWLAGHRGVDLRVGRGEPIHAAGAGVVAFVGVVVDRPVVSIDHPIGIRTTYEPVRSDLRRGEQVSAGAVIGHLAEGNSHCSIDCLHWGARIGTDSYIDPLRLLHPYRIRLYPPVPWEWFTPAGALA